MKNALGWAHPVFFGLSGFCGFAFRPGSMLKGCNRDWGGFGRLANGGRAAQAMAIPEPHRRRPEAVAACIRTCEANADRMQCDLYRKHGLPVGSSVAESACKHIFGNRFKTAGCRWSKAGANALLAIGCCLENIRRPDFLE